MKKKLLTTISLSLISLSLIGCSNKENNANKNTNISNSSSTTVENNKKTSENTANIDIVKDIVTNIVNLDESSSGSSLKTAKILVDILNNKDAFLNNEDESRKIVLQNTNTSDKNYTIKIDNIDNLGHDYFSKENNIEELINESGATINDNNISKEQFDKIIDILRLK